MVSTSKGWGRVRGALVPNDVEACLIELGLEILRDDEHEIYASCPGHLSRLGKEDRHTSWSVNRNSGIHHCFSCGFEGNFTSLVKELLGGSWEEATAWTKSRAGGIDRVRQVLDKPVRPPSRSVDTTTLVNEASLALFTSVPLEDASARHIDQQALDFYGVKWDSSHGTWIVPIRDPLNGKLWGWQEKNARFFRNYPDDVTKSLALFGYQQFKPESVAVLMESPLDVARLRTAGITGGLSSYGDRPSYTQLNRVLDATDTLIVAMDNDTAGKRSAADIYQFLAGRMTLRFFEYEGIDAKDIGEMTDEQIHQGFDNAYSSVLAKF